MCYFNMEKVEETKNAASSSYQKYLRNIEGTTKEDRETRYKNAFLNLRREITVQMATYCFCNALSVYVPEEISLDQSALELTNKNLPIIMKALWSNGMEEAEKEIEAVKETFLTEFYFPLCSKTLQA